MNRASAILLVLACLLLFTACPGSAPSTGGTPPAPTPPQITVANSINALAQAVDGAVTAAIAARDQGKVAQADVASIEAFAKVIATTGKQLDAEMRSTDTWATQKAKMIQLSMASGLSTLKTRISPTAQALVTTILIVFDQIMAAIGGPAI